YQTGWPRQLQRSPRLDATLVDIVDRRQAAMLAARSLIGRPRPDAVIVLHSVFSNEQTLGPRLLDAVRRIPAPKVLFLGNEYKLRPQRMAFVEELEARLVVSQLLAEPVLELYRRRLGVPVVALPNTGLDTRLFRPGPPLEERTIDLGYRSFPSPPYLGQR